MSCKSGKRAWNLTVNAICSTLSYNIWRRTPMFLLLGLKMLVSVSTLYSAYSDDMALIPLGHGLAFVTCFCSSIPSPLSRMVRSCFFFVPLCVGEYIDLELVSFFHERENYYTQVRTGSDQIFSFFLKLVSFFSIRRIYSVSKVVPKLIIFKFKAKHHSSTVSPSWSVKRMARTRGAPLPIMILASGTNSRWVNFCVSFRPDLTRYLLQIARSTLAREASTSKDPARHPVRGVRLLEDLGGEQGGDTVTVCAWGPSRGAHSFTLANGTE